MTPHRCRRPHPSHRRRSRSSSHRRLSRTLDIDYGPAITRGMRAMTAVLAVIDLPQRPTDVDLAHDADVGEREIQSAMNVARADRDLAAEVRAGTRSVKSAHGELAARRARAAIAKTKTTRCQRSATSPSKSRMPRCSVAGRGGGDDHRHAAARPTFTRSPRPDDRRRRHPSIDRRARGLRVNRPIRSRYSLAGAVDAPKTGSRRSRISELTARREGELRCADPNC